MNIQTTVITVSRNANAFGYKSVLCLAPCGRGFEVLKQAYGTDKLPVPGESLVVSPGGYLTRELNAVDNVSAAKVIADAKRTLV